MIRGAAVLIALAWLGCAAERDRPDAGGLTCESHEDCNRGRGRDDAGRCGALSLCVAGHCEAPADAGAAASRVVPCD